MARPFKPLNAKQEGFIRAEARGEPREQIMREFFDVDLKNDDENKIHRAECAMSRLRKRPEYNKIWADELKAVVRRRVPGAVNVIGTQIKKQDNDWLANKAANDYLTLASRMGLIVNEDEQSIHVSVEGMPELGTPDQDEE